MKYFTKEELEDITNELIENPTRETLNSLNEKYNGSVKSINSEHEMPKVETPIVESIHNIESQNDKILYEQHQVSSTMPPVEENKSTSNESVVNPILNTNTLNMGMPKTENIPTPNNIVTPEIPSFELQKVEDHAYGIQNNEPINFTGNLFDVQPPVVNLMQTTDNFNLVPNTMPTTEVPLTDAPFFGPHISGENNPIPVGGAVNSMPTTTSTMFGQLEQNYM